MCFDLLELETTAIKEIFLMFAKNIYRCYKKNIHLVNKMKATSNTLLKSIGYYYSNTMNLKIKSETIYTTSILRTQQAP